jgi:hypothetical protein
VLFAGFPGGFRSIEVQAHSRCGTRGSFPACRVMRSRGDLATILPLFSPAPRSFTGLLLVLVLSGIVLHARQSPRIGNGLYAYIKQTTPTPIPLFSSLPRVSSLWTQAGISGKGGNSWRKNGADRDLLPVSGELVLNFHWVLTSS